MNKEEKAAYDKKYRAKNKEKRRAYIEANREKIRQQTSDYYFKHKERLSNGRAEYRREYYQKNKAIISVKNKKHNSRHAKTPKRKEYFNKYRRERRKTDLNYKILGNIRGRMKNVLKGCKKYYRSEDVLGCSMEFFKQYIAKQFKPGMSWDNWGYNTWHIDHIKPCSLFDFTKESEQKACFHYTNMQPLFAKENIKKRDKYNEGLQAA